VARAEDPLPALAFQHNPSGSYDLGRSKKYRNTILQDEEEWVLTIPDFKKFMMTMKNTNFPI
jgi:hypothetical protein